MNEKTNNNVTLHNKKNFFIEKWYVSLFLILLGGLIIRLYYFPYDIPIILDGQLFFWYATDISILGKFAGEYQSPHIVWPGFLAIFFAIFQSNNFLDFMTLQRLITLSISVFTAIPVFFLCKRFFEPKFALVGVCLFVFEPRIIQNSLFGVTDTLFIFLSAISLCLFLSTEKKIMYAAFMTTGLATLIRPEGIFLFLGLSIMFFIKFRKDHNTIPKYFLVLSIFILTMLPMTIIRFDLGIGDPVTGRLFLESTFIATNVSENNLNLIFYWINGLENPIKLIGWSLIPIFILFIPPGVFLILRRIGEKEIFIIITIFSMIIPAIYALSRASDTRYLYPLYPLLCIVSLYFIQFSGEKIRYSNLFLSLIIVGVIIASIGYLEYKIDNQHEREALEIAFQVNKFVKITNSYFPESMYLSIPSFTENYPLLSTEFIDNSPKVIDFKGKTINEFFEWVEKENLTHVIIDLEDNRPYFFEEIYNNEQDYPMLVKIFDSSEHSFDYSVKIFEINVNELKMN